MDPSILILVGAIALVIIALWLLRRPSAAPVQAPYETVPKALYTTLVTQHEMLRTELTAKEQEIREYTGLLAARDTALTHLEQLLQQRQHEAAQLHEQAHIQFENVANRLLEEKSQRFSQQNIQQMQLILGPLREKIREFETHIDRKFSEETRDKSMLKREIEQLRDLNQQLSRDANNLAGALKGQNKTQGDWGELQLEVLLERAGLQKDTHFLTQNTFRDETGAAKRPDFIIQLPQNRHLIIDAKVSLTAFERFFNENDPVRREQHLRAHVDSIRRHIDDLSRKNYPDLPQLNTPDYLLLFIPLENALSVAAQADPRLFNDALDRNIVLVTNSSLMATMRTVAHLWKQEKQARSVQEIARQGGLLYDKFVAFVEDLRTVGTRMDSARTAYDEAMLKLVNGTRPGDTLIGRAERLRQLGAKNHKTLPAEMLQEEREEGIEMRE